MAYSQGDIVITSENVGHVLMCYQGGANSTFYHATNAKGCTVEDFLGAGSLFNENTAACFRFNAQIPWDRIKRIADRLQGVKYSIYGAIQLAVGASEFGKGARSDLMEHEKKMMTEPGGKIVQSVTCCQAVILCYQLAFAESDNQFIKKDASHTMPHTLREYLANSAHWTKQ